MRAACLLRGRRCPFFHLPSAASVVCVRRGRVAARPASAALSANTGVSTGAAAATGTADSGDFDEVQETHVFARHLDRGRVRPRGTIAAVATVPPVAAVAPVFAGLGSGALSSVPSGSAIPSVPPAATVAAVRTVRADDEAAAASSLSWSAVAGGHENNLVSGEFPRWNQRNGRGARGRHRLPGVGPVVAVQSVAPIRPTVRPVPTAPPRRPVDGPQGKASTFVEG